MNEEIQEQISPFGTTFENTVPTVSNLAGEALQEGVGTFLDPYFSAIADSNNVNELGTALANQFQTDIGQREGTADRWKDIGKSALGGAESAVVLGLVANPSASVQEAKATGENILRHNADVAQRLANTSNFKEATKDIDVGIGVADANAIGKEKESANRISNALHEQKMSVAREYAKAEYLQSTDGITRRAAQDANSYIIHHTAEMSNGKVSTQLADDIATLSNSIGVAVQFDSDLTDNKGVQINGHYENGVIHINVNDNVSDSAATIYAHELSHALQDSDAYEKYASQLEKMVENKTLNIDINALQNEIKDAYKGISAKDLKYETTARLTQEIFGNQAAINQIVAQNRNVATRIAGWINDTIQQVRGDRNKADLIKAKKLFEKALNNPSIQIHNEYELMSRPIEKGGNAYPVDEETYITTDSNGNETLVFKLSPEAREKLGTNDVNGAIKKYLKEKFKGKLVNIGNLYDATFPGKSAGHFVFPDRYLDENTRSAKRATGIALQELFERGKFNRFSDVKNSKHPDAKGFDYFDVSFGIDTGNGIEKWDARIDVKVNKEDEVSVYDISDLKNRSANSAVESDNTHSAFGTSATSNISKNEGAVNTESQNKGYDSRTLKHNCTGNEKLVFESSGNITDVSEDGKNATLGQFEIAASGISA